MNAADMNHWIIRANEFRAEAKKWGKHVNQPFSAGDLLNIIDAYETKAEITIRDHDLAQSAVHEAHQRHIAELTGKIGGLTKQLNATKK